MNIIGSTMLCLSLSFYVRVSLILRKFIRKRRAVKPVDVICILIFHTSEWMKQTAPLQYQFVKFHETYSESQRKAENIVLAT